MARWAGFGREAVPLLRQNDYGGAVSLMTSRVADVIAQDAGIELTGSRPQVSPPPQEPDNGLSWKQLLILGVILLVVLLTPLRKVLFWMLLFGMGGGGGGGYGGGGGFGGGGGGFGGFGGGSSGGGGASGSW